MNIIKSGIVDSKYDSFWADVSPVVNGAPPKCVLVIASGCEPGSDEANQLQKMLEACKLQPMQYNIVRISLGESVAWHQLRQQLSPKVIFLVGVMPSQLGISASFRLNEPNSFSDCVWLPTLSISELEQHPAAKSQLWSGGMKPIFVDKKYGEIH